VVVGMNVVVTGVDKSPPFPQISCPSMRAATRLGRVPDANRYWNLRSKWAPGVKSASQDRLVRWKTRLSVVVTRAYNDNKICLNTAYFYLNIPKCVLSYVKE
jgi:hypothetical protein